MGQSLTREIAAPVGGHIHPFTVDIAAETLDDLRQRIEKTRWSHQVEDTGWAGGTDGAYLKELMLYWREQYDWRKEEQALNQLAHYRTEIDDVGIHFIHERGKGPEPFPLILTHGYPDSFYRFIKLIPLLKRPRLIWRPGGGCVRCHRARYPGLRILRHCGD